jgi:hypothetical protein
MVTYQLRRALTCYHCARAAGYLIYDATGARVERYEPAPGEARPMVAPNGRLVCRFCQGPFYQSEAERVYPLEKLEPEPPRKRGRPRKHPLPTPLLEKRAS